MNIWKQTKFVAAGAALLGVLSACGQPNSTPTDTATPAATDSYSTPMDMSTAPAAGMTPSTGTSTTR